MTQLQERLQAALDELTAWQKDAQPRRSAILHWSLKISALASRVAEEAMELIIEDISLEEIREKENEDGNAE
jgi:hypothetical protein